MQVLMIIIPLKFLLTMCFGCLAAGPSNLAVIQIPPEIHLSVGDTIKIDCVWEIPVERYRVIWYLNKQNTTKNVSNTISYVSNNRREHKNVLEINTASVNDTGTYYCEVIIEIPFYKKSCGNGTAVTVYKQEAHSLKKRDMAVWAIIPFLVAVGGLYLCCRKKQHSKPSGSAQLPVPAARLQEEQMPKAAELNGRNESTKEAAEENSFSNSAEWAVSTLYESLDSFFAMNQEEKMTNPQQLLYPTQQMPRTRAAEKFRMRQASAICFDIQN